MEKLKYIELEHFSLKELKNIFKIMQKEYNLLKDFKIYKLNKYDLVCLLRNTKKFNEKYNNYVLLKKDNIELQLFPNPRKTSYRGNKIEGLIFHNEPITLHFS